MTKKEQAHKLAVEIFSLQQRAAEIPVFLALPVIKQATKKQTELNHLLVENMSE